MRNVSVLLERRPRSVLSTFHVFMLARRNIAFGNYNRFSTHFSVGSGTSSGTFENCHYLHCVRHCWKFNELHFSTLSTGSKFNYIIDKTTNNLCNILGRPVSIPSWSHLIISYHSNFLSLEATQKALPGFNQTFIDSSMSVRHEHVAMAAELCRPHRWNLFRNGLDIRSGSVR